MPTSCRTDVGHTPPRLSQSCGHASARRTGTRVCLRAPTAARNERCFSLMMLRVHGRVMQASSPHSLPHTTRGASTCDSVLSSTSQRTTHTHTHTRPRTFTNTHTHARPTPPCLLGLQQQQCWAVIITARLGAVELVGSEREARVCDTHQQVRERAPHHLHPLSHTFRTVPCPS
jgi:hypothetical protein